MLRRIIVTGFSGFVARHYLDFLVSSGTEDQVNVLGLDIVAPSFDIGEYNIGNLTVSFRSLNLMDAEAVQEIIKEYGPTEILHLAAFSSVKYSWEHPADCFLNNTRVFMSVVEAVRTQGLQCRILSVGSSEIYGDVTEDMLPIREDMPINPLSPYAIARQSQELLAKVFSDRFGMDIILTRSFNHIGPRQDQRFVVPSFIARVMEARKHLVSGESEITIETGDISIVRDFLDVRDVVRAYELLLRSGRKGEIYNIARNDGISLAGLIELISQIAGVTVKTVTNPTLIRPTDNPRIVGSYDKIRIDVGWEPSIPLEKTLMDMMELVMEV